MEKYTLNEKNEAQDRINKLEEQKRRLGDSNQLRICGSNKGDGTWSSNLSDQDYQDTAEYLKKKWTAEVKELRKIVDA
jgi:hypothetical protein